MQRSNPLKNNNNNSTTLQDQIEKIKKLVAYLGLPFIKAKTDEGDEFYINIQTWQYDVDFLDRCIVVPSTVATIFGVADNKLWFLIDGAEGLSFDTKFVRPAKRPFNNLIPLEDRDEPKEENKFLNHLINQLEDEKTIQINARLKKLIDNEFYRSEEDPTHWICRVENEKFAVIFDDSIDIYARDIRCLAEDNLADLDRLVDFQIWQAQYFKNVAQRVRNEEARLKREEAIKKWQPEYSIWKAKYPEKAKIADAKEEKRVDAAYAEAKANFKNNSRLFSFKQEIFGTEDRSIPVNNRNDYMEL